MDDDTHEQRAVREKLRRMNTPGDPLGPVLDLVLAQELRPVPWRRRVLDNLRRRGRPWSDREED